MKRLLLGPHAVVEALRSGASHVSVVYLAADGGKALDEVRRSCERAGARWEARERKELDALARGRRHQAVVGIAGEYSYLSLPELRATLAPHPLLVALDQITDPHNFGAILRSAVALGADGVITLKDRSVSVTPTVVRVAAGATEVARIARVTNLARTLEQLADDGLQIVGLDAGGREEVSALPFPRGGRVLVIGAEGAGLRRLTRERCDTLARIPLTGSLQSLNASVAAGIAIYASAEQRRNISHEHQASEA